MLNSRSQPIVSTDFGAFKEFIKHSSQHKARTTWILTGRPDLRGHKVDEVAVAIDDPEPLSCHRCPRLSSLVGIALVVILQLAMPFAELIHVLEVGLHLSERWSGEGQEQ